MRRKRNMMTENKIFENAERAVCRITVLAAVMVACMTVTAFAMTKYVDLEIDTDNLPEHNAGESFMPEFVLSSENDEHISISFRDKTEANANPTIPYNYEIKIASDNESLDEDLEIRGSGIRSTYVDFVSADNSSAEGRLQVYPFYRLTAPVVSINKNEKRVSWGEVPYAGKYEYVLTYTTKQGDTKTVHGITKQTFVSAAQALSEDADGEIGAAVRALATEEEGYAQARIENGTAYWDFMDWADKYRIRISYTSPEGKKVKQEYNAAGTSYNVQSYINSSSDGKVSVEVRAVPRQNEYKYYNIALSEFGTAGGEASDTGKYEIDDPWEFLADYSAAVNGSFASNIIAATGNRNIGTVNNVPGGEASASSSASSSSSVSKVSGPGSQADGSDTLKAGTGEASGTSGSASSGVWNRVTYRWQYLINGVPFDRGWMKLGEAWYYFDTDGFMHTGWLTDTDGKSYYLESVVGTGQGQMVTGERSINGRKYIFDEDGVCTNRNSL